MNEPFDDFIRTRKAAFDTEEPPVDMWERIAAQVDIAETPARRTIGLQWVKYAAAVAVIVASGVWAWLYQSPKQQAVPIASAFEAQINEASRYYEQEITQKQRLVMQLTADQPAVSEGIAHDMAQLDSSLVQLKRDLGDNVANAEVVEAMIQNYRLKLSILEEVLGYLKSNEQPSEQNSNTHEL